MELCAAGLICSADNVYSESSTNSHPPPPRQLSFKRSICSPIAGKVYKSFQIPIMKESTFEKEKKNGFSSCCFPAPPQKITVCSRACDLFTFHSFVISYWSLFKQSLGSHGNCFSARFHRWYFSATQSNRYPGPRCFLSLRREKR